MVRPHRFELELGCAQYPAQLAETPNPPKVLYGIGCPDALVMSLGVVGARRATSHGLTAAKQLAAWAAGAGYTIVSGVAVGCDQAAHKGALEADGCTIGVLPGGADVTYPSGAVSLLASIAEAGAVVSEHPWGTEPRRWTFRTRNRIIAGLSAAVLVVEASVPSGTFSTADYAVDAGREVWAVPGSIYAPECRGPNRLIRQGATPITDASDLAQELAALLGPPSADPCRWSPGGGLPADEVLRVLRSGPSRPDDIAYALGQDVLRVVARLGVLQAAGHVVRQRDGRYGICR